MSLESNPPGPGGHEPAADPEPEAAPETEPAPRLGCPAGNRQGPIACAITSAGGAAGRGCDRRDPCRWRPVLLGLDAGSPGGADARDPGRGGRRVPAVLGHLLRDHQPVRRWQRGPQGADRGRDPGHDRSPRRPVLAVPEPGRLQGVAPGHRRTVRGHRRHDRNGRCRRDDLVLFHPRAGLPAVDRRPPAGIAGGEGRPAAG